MSGPEKIKEHLNHILEQVANQQNIENFELNPDTNAKYGDGFVAEFCSGDIYDKDTGKIISVAVKKAPIWDFEYKELFKNENLFYDTVLPALDDLQKETNILKLFDNVPKYFGGSMELKKEYVAMENLKQCGYIMLDKKKYFDKEHLELIFKTYRRLHTLSFVLRHKHLEKYRKIAKEITDLSMSIVEFEGKSITFAFSAAVNALDPEKDKVVYNHVKDISENLLETYKKFSKYNGEYTCLIHGDGWSNNMFFKYSESGELLDLKLIDFQLCRDGTPIHDLSYFFYSGASKKDFDNLENYLQTYYKSFSDFAKELGGDPNELLPFEVLKKEWKENALTAVVYAIYLWQIKLLPQESFQNLVQNTDIKALSEKENAALWVSVLAETCESEIFKNSTTAILRHAVEYEIIKK